MSIQMEEYKYFAFISYSTKNSDWGKRLHTKLEHYRLSATLRSRYGWKRRPISPVFFAPYEIQPGDLGEELRGRLRQSKNLIVICSPESAQSEWVSKEIEYFYSLGRRNNIYFFIIDGIPNSGNEKTECLNPIIKRLGFPEILGVNVNEKIYPWKFLNRERAFIQLISKLLGIEYDSIWQRHRRRLFGQIIKIISIVLMFFVSILYVWRINRIFDMEINLEETSIHNPHLPKLNNAIVTLYLDKETKIDTINDGEVGIFRDIPHRYLNKNMRITFKCDDFECSDTIIPLSSSISLKIKRDPTIYGNIQSELWDFEHGAPIPNATVILNQWQLSSDDKGKIKFFIPLELQRVKYKINIPAFHLTDSIEMPLSPDHCISIIP